MHIIILGEGVFVKKTNGRKHRDTFLNTIQMEVTGSYILAMDDGSEIKLELLKFILFFFF